jgi:hypothetical protein
MKINISDIAWDKFIYPRENKSQKTISAYIEALSIGAKCRTNGSWELLEEHC